MRSQHFDLYSDFSQLVEKAEKLLYHETNAEACGGLADGYSRFLERFHDHEARENELILEAFDEDLGGGD